jgi:ankyrin repeat protein
VAKSLLELGADINLVDNLGRTPIMSACRAGNKELVELLITYKADCKV